jgi:TolB-like protein/Flp pilus assembly protein TadD
VVAGAALGWWWTGRRSAPISIAVLPLENTGHDPANDYFADGLTDELIRNLAIIDGLEVRSRTSSFGLKDRPHSIHEAGTQLQADYILEGSVLRAGEHLRIDAQLVRVRDDFSMWSGKFDSNLTDVFAIQDEIALAIVNNLRLKLGRGRRRYETSVEAYDLYLRGRAIPQRGKDKGSIGMYQQAIAKDSNFAPAYAALAARLAAESAQGFRDDKTEELKQMRAAAERAIQLDLLLAEAHQGLAMAYARDGQWAESEKSFRRAIELDPSDGLTYRYFAIELLLPLGRADEALREIRIGEKMDPLSREMQSAVGWVLLTNGKYAEAATHYDRVPEYRADLARVRVAQGRTDEAIRILATASTPREFGYLGYAYGRSGRRAEAEKIAADVADNAFSQALIFAGLGDKDRTLGALERVIPLGALRIGRALNDPEFAFLRDDPRAIALRKKVGLPQ